MQSFPHLSASDLASAVIHGVGLLASIWGMVLSAQKIREHAKPRAVLACLTFAAVMGMMYSASIIYHVIPPVLKGLALLLDQLAILAMIGGTALSYEVMAKRPGNARGPLNPRRTARRRVLICAGTVAAIAWQVQFRSERFSFILIAVGLSLFVVTNAAEQPCPGFHWILAGGLVYLLGIPFLAASETSPLAHPLWHIAVLGGNGCHYEALRVAARRRSPSPLTTNER